jgi:selenocysteine lyase/cysteine desulfurase
LATTAAFDLLEEVRLPMFRARTHYLAQYARHRLVELTGQEPPTPDSETWYGSMVSVPLPPGDAAELQKQLWQQHHIEVPVVDRGGRRSIRVSCHLYTHTEEIDRLVSALAGLLGKMKP